MGVALSEQFEWNTAAVARLSALWDDGLSASQIAAELGGVSRNAVLGKVHRLGLGARLPRAMVSREERREKRNKWYRDRRAANTAVADFAKLRARKAAEQNGWFGVPEPEPEPLAHVAGQPCTLLELTGDTCRFPIGDPGDADFRFCGGLALFNQPYCRGHMRVCYQPPRERRASCA